MDKANRPIFGVTPPPPPAKKSAKPPAEPRAKGGKGKQPDPGAPTAPAKPDAAG